MLTKAELQRLRSLREKKNREALGLFVVEGEKVVAELLTANFPFVEIYATGDWSPPTGASAPRESAALSRRKDHRVATPATNDIPPASPSPAVLTAPVAPQPQPAARVVRVTTNEMARASHFPTPSSVLAVGKMVRAALRPRALEAGLTLALDSVQDAGNVGTLLRIADWFAFDRVIMSPDCADVFHQKVINASMGSFARVPVHTADLPSVLAELACASAATRTLILGCDLEGDDVHTLPRLRDAVVVIGSEGRGLSPAVAAHLTQRVTIPRYGRAESLNAAIAAAIVCDHLRRGP